MFSNLPKILILVAIILTGVFLFYPFIQPANAALVPCGLQEDDPTTPEDETRICTTCDVFVLLSRVINFVIFTLVPAIAVLLYLWAGFMILLGGAHPGWVSTGTNIFKTTTWGVIIVFTSWMIANTVLKSLAGNYFDGQQDPWFRVVCMEPGTIAAPPLPPPPAPDIAQVALAQPIARELINLGINFSTDADCGNNFHARQNIQDIADAEYPAVCSVTCDCQAGGQNGNVTVNWSLLAGLRDLHNELTSSFGVGFRVTSLTTGRHSANSSHYTGEGVDIVVNSNNPSVWRAARAFLDSLGGNAICERDDSTDDPNCNLADINHIHWTLRR